jgi:acetyl esterase/lipase
MIHPELRRKGLFFRLVLPRFTERMFRMASAVAVRTMAGKCRSELRYEQAFTARPDGSALRLCVYSPLSPKADVPGLLWIHGGGYGLGVPEQDEVFIRRFVEASDCVVVSPDYTLSIDKPYPAALEDCYAALLWLKESSDRYGIRDDQIFVGGESAGGGLAAAVSLYARDKGEVAIAFQMPLYPMIDDRMNTASAMNNNAPLWNSKSNNLGWKLYLGDLFGIPDVSAYAAPAHTDDFNGLPPTCTYVGSIEPFCDETITYVENLRSHGIPVTFKVFDGCFHGFDIVCPKSKVAHEATEFLLDCFHYAVENYYAKQSCST